MVRMSTPEDEKHERCIARTLRSYHVSPRTQLARHGRQLPVIVAALRVLNASMPGLSGHRWLLAAPPVERVSVAAKSSFQRMALLVHEEDQLQVMNQVKAAGVRVS